MKKTVLITGAAGFIGFHLSKALLEKGFNVVGLDNLNSYYDPALKKSRLDILQSFTYKTKKDNKFTFHKVDISNINKLQTIFKKSKFNIVINLAAQAGVRYSIDKPHEYVNSNLVGFVNVLECCRSANVEHFIFASSSSVYGMNKKVPFSTEDITDHPISLYAATKKSNEMIAHSYSHLYDIPSTGLRFFTVYGPYGRPDMAYFKFAKAINNNIPIDLYNHGNMKRDFTYIDDVVTGIIKVITKPKISSKSKYTKSNAKFNIYNIGNNNPVTLNRFIKSIEVSLSKKAIKNMMKMQDGDVPITYADIDDFRKDYGFEPETSIEEGMKKFISWYLTYNHA